MRIEEIPWPEVGEIIEVVTFWEEGIKGLEICIARVPIPARNIRPQAHAWVKAYVIPRVTDVRGHRPGPDVPAAKATPLIEGFEVIVPAVGRARLTGDQSGLTGKGGGYRRASPPLPDGLCPYFLAK